jgi:subfamily B ATP-binding cassette protein MsbA
MAKYARIFNYLAPYRSQLFLYVICILLSTIFSLLSFGMLMPFLELIFIGKSGTMDLAAKSEGGSNVMDWVRNQITAFKASKNGNPMAVLWLICGLMMGSILLKNIFFYLSLYILNPLKNQVVTSFRADLYDKVLRLPIGYFTEQRKGDLMSRITNDIAEIETSIVGTLEGWFKDPLQIILTLTALFFLSTQLTLFLLVLLPLVGFIIGRISRSLKKQSMAAAEKQGEAVSVLDETLGGLRVIKAFNAEKVLREKFFNINETLLTVKNKINRKRDLASPLSETMGIFVFCCILLYGGYLIFSTSSSLEPAMFMTYLGMFYNIISPAKNLSNSFYNIQKGSAAIGRIEEVLNADVTIEDIPDAIALTSFNDKIEFRNVTFRYDDVTILDNINLVIQKGKTVALVGSSGAGKSTLADLVPRFHDVTEGELLIDGINIKKYSLNSVRSHMGIVTQEPILFNDTVAANIALGMSNASEEAITRAANVANAHHFIENKELGYYNNIGDRGGKLSGGERQRITIARAVLKNPPILILDEATSSLDTESEKLVQDAINKVMANRTTIVIAHRLSTIRHADEIIVLQKGKIVQRGTHNSLIEQEGLYKRLIEMQEVK